jgi:hypothetical protein
MNVNEMEHVFTGPWFSVYQRPRSLLQPSNEDVDGKNDSEIVHVETAKSGS